METYHFYSPLEFSDFNFVFCALRSSNIGSFLQLRTLIRIFISDRSTWISFSSHPLDCNSLPPLIFPTLTLPLLEQRLTNEKDKNEEQTVHKTQFEMEKMGF